MKRYGNYSLVLALVFLVASCTYYKNEIFIPPVPEEKPTLEAEFVTSPPNNINASYWTTADYLVVDVQDVVNEKVADEDGLVNVNGMYNGVADFNGGEPAGLILKAAYDDQYVYILASWNDKTFDASDGNWFYKGPSDPLKPGQDTTGWTSQRNDDNFVMAFLNDGSDKDIWKWSLALSEPMGYAVDMFDDGTGWNFDAGENIFIRNAASDPYLSGPEFEWNGEQQELTRDPAGFTILDPGFYLFNKTDFLANIVNGESRYQQRCGICHGRTGKGDGSFNNTGVGLTEPGKYNRVSVEALDASLSVDSTHSGATYWNRLTEQDKIDVVARMRAFSGIPGSFLQVPAGSSSDILAVSNVQLGKINMEAENSAGYKVLLIRKLDTGNPDDIRFDLSAGRTYEFDVYVMDKDDDNLVGAISKQMTFK